MKEIKINLTDTQWKAMSIYTPDPFEWAEGAVTAYADRCIEEIFMQEVQRMSLDPSVESIPADRETIVMNANLLTAIEKNAQALSNSPF